MLGGDRCEHVLCLEGTGRLPAPVSRAAPVVTSEACGTRREGPAGQREDGGTRTLLTLFTVCGTPHSVLL